MARYKCMIGIVLPDRDDPENPRAGLRYLKNEVFEAEPPTREVRHTRKANEDWLTWAERLGHIIKTDEPLSAPGRTPSGVWPVSSERLREDGSVTEIDPGTEELE